MNEINVVHNIRDIMFHPFLYILRGIIYCINKPQYKEYYFSDKIIKPILITPKCIKIKKNVVIRNNARIEGVRQYNDMVFSPSIILEENVHIEQNCHITCADKIYIGRNTAIAANVTITDIHHPYTDVTKPIEGQNLVVRQVIIGEDCKINNGAVILQGVQIGKHVTIGANSVVMHSIPDYSVAVGSPAIIIKRYNFESQKWEKTDKKGNFMK